MSKLDPRFVEDRALRNAAREVFLADLAYTRASFSGKALADRFVSRVGDGAKDVFETAKDHTEDNHGMIAALIGAVILWFARGPILEVISELIEDSEPEIADTDGPEPNTDEPVATETQTPPSPNGADNEQ